MEPLLERDLSYQHGHITVLDLARLSEIAQSDEAGELARSAQIQESPLHFLCVSVSLWFENLPLI